MPELNLSRDTLTHFKDENALLNSKTVIRKYVHNRFNVIFISLALLVIVYSSYGDIYRILLGGPHHMDFWHFYWGARAMLLGSNLYESGSGGYIYPPFFAFLLLPLACLSLKVAQFIWLGVNLLLIAITLLTGLRVLSSAFGLNMNRWQALGVCSLAILLGYDQIRWELIQGQSDTLAMAGMALSLYWLDRRPAAAGAFLGLMALIKYQAIFFLPLLLLRGRWRAAGFCAAAIISAALLPALVVGWDRNLDYLNIALQGLTSMDHSLPGSLAARMPDITWYRNISITNGLARLFIEHHLPTKSLFLMIFTIAFLVYLLIAWVFQLYHIPLFWRSPQWFKNPQKEKAILNIEWAILTIGMLAFSPQCTARHFFILLNVNLLAAVMLMLPLPSVKRWPIVIAVLIVQISLGIHGFFPNFSAWNHIGGPGWSLIPFLFIMVWSSLAYITHRE